VKPRAADASSSEIGVLAAAVLAVDVAVDLVPVFVVIAAFFVAAAAAAAAADDDGGGGIWPNVWALSMTPVECEYAARPELATAA